LLLVLRWWRGDCREIGLAHYVVEILEPAQVTDLTFFLLPGSPVPPGYGGESLWVPLTASVDRCSEL
jgi:hypothetical protein